MNIRQVYSYFKDKKDTPCPLTERLIKAGYRQTSGGYIDIAKKHGLVVDYSLAKPTQYWHLIEEYCPSVDPDKAFSKSIICGELIFWMAEVSGSIPQDELEGMLDKIIGSRDNSTSPPIYDRRKWNKEIQNLCFDAIRKTVEE